MFSRVFFFIVFLRAFSFALLFTSLLKIFSFHKVVEIITLNILIIGLSLSGILSKYIKADFSLYRRVISVSLLCFLGALAFVIVYAGIPSDLNSFIKYFMSRPFIFSVVFLPFFVVWGLCEIVELEIGTKFRKVHYVYALTLIGVASGYAFFTISVAMIRLFGILSVAFLTTGIINRFFGNSRLLLVGIFIFISALIVKPNFEYVLLPNVKSFLFVRGGDDISVVGQNSDNMVIDKFVSTVLFNVKEFPSGYIGFYDGYLIWDVPKKVDEGSYHLAPFKLVGEGKKILIVGAGGGVQVKGALIFNPSEVVAVDIVNIFDEMKKIDNTYLSPSVRTIVADGRKFVERSEESYDLIYLAFTDPGFPKPFFVFDPVAKLYTLEAISEFKKHLTEKGVLAVCRFALRKSSFEKMFIEKITGAFEMVGLNTKVYRITQKFFQYCVIGCTWDCGELDYPVLKYTPGEPAEDDKPYIMGMGGSMAHAIRYVIPAMSFLVFLSVVLIGVKLGGELKTMLFSFFTGLNFSFLTNLVFIKMMDILNPLYAVYLSSIIFLIFAFFGAFVKIGKKGALMVSAWLITYIILGYSEIFLLPVFVLSGSFFPELLRKREKVPLVYALDSVGTAVGFLVFLYLILFVGISTFVKISLITFFLGYLSFMLWWK